MEYPMKVLMVHQPQHLHMVFPVVPPFQQVSHTTRMPNTRHHRQHHKQMHQHMARMVSDLAGGHASSWLRPVLRPWPAPVRGR